MRGGAAFVVFASMTAMSLAVSSSASAQQVKPLLPIASSDTLTLPDARDAIAMQPLRLGLMSGAVPHPFGTPGCEPSGRATGLSPMPNQRLAANGIHLFSDLRLTVFGFSRDGCAFDQLAGGGMTLSVPIKKDVMFMWSGGAIYLPHAGPNGTNATESSIRMDVVWQGQNGRAYMVGIGAKNGGPHVSFGGVF
jgi:hypothetical protein